SFFGNTQVNPKFTVHTGVAAEAAYHLRENLAAQVGVWYFPISVQSALSEEMLTKGRVAPESAEAFLLRYAALAGLELMPVYGKLNVFDGKILRLGMYLNAGLGAAKTRVQLRPSSDPSTGRTFGDTGFRPIASLGLGLRVFLGEQLTVRVELRDFAYSGYVSRVNGCNQAEAEYHLAQGLERMGFPFSAFAHYAAIVSAGPANPYYLKAIDAAASAAERLRDDVVAPNLFEKAYGEPLSALAPQRLARIRASL